MFTASSLDIEIVYDPWPCEAVCSVASAPINGAKNWTVRTVRAVKESAEIVYPKSDTYFSEEEPVLILIQV